MKSVSVYCQSVDVHLDTGPDIRDITALLKNMIHESKVENGGLCATMVGSTGSLTTIEYEPGVVRDLMAAVNRLAPPDLEYEHERPGMTATVTAMFRPRYWALQSLCRFGKGA
jgi:thiamine phosphate synthase YjbQ (UPF0047 family)